MAIIRFSINGPAIAGTPANLVTTASSSLSFGGNFAGINIPSVVVALNNLTINNTDGVSLNSSPAIDGVLTLSSGALAIGSNTLTLNGTIAGDGFLKGSGSSNLVVGGSGALGTLQFDQTISGVTNVLKSLLINRTPSGSATIGNDLILTGPDLRQAK